MYLRNTATKTKPERGEIWKADLAITYGDGGMECKMYHKLPFLSITNVATTNSSGAPSRFFYHESEAWRASAGSRGKSDDMDKVREGSSRASSRR